MSEQNSRRDFLKLAGLGLVATAVASKTQNAFGADAPQMVSEKDQLAQSLGYHNDAKKVDTKKWPKRAGADGAKQFCHTCQFFQGKETDKAAACTIFSGKQVNGNGWCNSWSPKAAKA